MYEEGGGVQKCFLGQTQVMLRMCHKFSDLNDGSITGKLAVNLNKLNYFCLFTFQETWALPRSITRVRPR